MKASEALLFFAQTIEELTYDYTPCEYRLAVKSTHQLAEEARFIIRGSKNGTFPDGAERPVLQELANNLKVDPVARELLGPLARDVAHAMPDADTPSEERQRFVSSVVGQLRGSDGLRYLVNLQGAIRSRIEDEPGAKRDIYWLTAAFVHELVSAGFPTRFIYEQNYRFFFDARRNRKIQAADVLNDFFGVFHREDREFTVVFRVSAEFKHIATALAGWEIVVQETWTGASAKEEDFKKEWNGLFAVCKVKAGSPDEARGTAETRLDTASDIFNFLHHKQRPTWSDDALVFDADSKLVGRITSATRLASRGETRIEDVDERFGSTLTHLVNDYDEASLRRVTRSLNLHGTAVGASDSENELISLWAALEALLPLSNAPGRKRISQVLELVRPALVYSYYPRLVHYYLSDLRRWNKARTSSILCRSIGDSQLERVVSLLACEECRPLREELYAAMDNSPLLRNRTMVLHDMMASGAAVSRALRDFETSLEWNLRRVYRARNSIVHSGLTSVPGVDNATILHDYYDQVITVCSRYASTEIGLDKLEDILWTVGQVVQSRYRHLAECGPVTPSTCLAIVIGDRLDLQPGAAED